MLLVVSVVLTTHAEHSFFAVTSRLLGRMTGLAVVRSRGAVAGRVVVRVTVSAGAVRVRRGVVRPPRGSRCNVL